MAEAKEKAKTRLTAHDLGQFIGAGVLPYSISGGRVKFFLGKELSKGRTLTGDCGSRWCRASAESCVPVRLCYNVGCVAWVAMCVCV